MSESSNSSPSQPRTPKWIVLSTALVLALSVGALFVAERSSRARKAQEDELKAQQEKLKTIETQLGEKLKEQEQKLAAQQEELTSMRRSRFRVSRLPITLNKTGNEICSEHGEVCVAVTPSKAYDAQDRFCGYNMIDCNSRIRAAEGCGKTDTGEVYNYRIDRTSFATSPGADGKCEESSSPCLSEPVHNDAICTGERSERPDSRRRRRGQPPPAGSASAVAPAASAPAPPAPAP
jgi:hypothetical protein